MDFKLEQNVKVLVTDNFVDDLTNTLKETNYKKPMVVIDSFLLGTKIIKDALAKLKENGYEYFVYDAIIPNPPASIIDEGASLFKENNLDSVVAIGGGSTIDSARGINIVRHLGGKILDYVSDKKIDSKLEGLISVPTTSGTGSELSNALIVSDDKTDKKLAILSNDAVSEIAILAPELLVTLPKGMTSSTGLDVFSHAAEAYTSNLNSPVVDAICEKIMFLVVKYLPKAYKNGADLKAREEMMSAAALGGWVLNNGGTHLGHSMAHILGAEFNIPHGIAVSYSLPATLILTAQVKPNKVREIGNILGAEFPPDVTDYEIGTIVASAYREFRDDVLEIKPIEEFNISREDILAMTDEVVNERFASNSPFAINENSVKHALEMFG